TGLDIQVAEGVLQKPNVWDPLLEILWERGARHEQAFVEHLKSEGCSATVIEGIGIDDEAISRTRQAMIAGDEIIVQGAFRSDGWVGRTDILRKVNLANGSDGWAYEVIDTKLARETKGASVLQLCLYADLVAIIQGKRPPYSYIAVPHTDFVPQEYRMDDYAAYYRKVK